MKPSVLAALSRMSRFPVEPAYPNIGAMISLAASIHQDRILIDCFEDGQALSYAQFDKQSTKFGNGLLHLGVGFGMRVATMLPNTVDYPVVWAALAKIGAVMVPVATTSTSRELEYVLTDADVSALIIAEEHLPILDGIAQCPDGLDRRKIAVLTNKPKLAEFATVADLTARGSTSLQTEAGVGPDTIIGLQYTSGTTGFPKGCVVSHDYWMLLSRALRSTISQPPKRILSPNPFSYMNGRNLLLAALEEGGTLYLARKPSIARFMDWVRDLGIDWCWFPQLVLRQTPEGGNDRRHRLKEVGIAAYTREAHKELEHRFGVAAREIYGMTEIGAALSVPPECGEMSGSGSVGIPMLARTATIRDQNGAPVRVGDTGELWVRGPSMLTEYYRKPAANAESFRDGWFRTGDLCRQDDEGFYYIVGRLKDMVRRNSENIAAREVEEVALQVSFVEDAAVVPVPDSRRGEEVKLYVILKSGRECNVETIDAILRHMRGSLAAFKLPRYVAFATSFPRGPSNKIEKGPLKAAPDLRLGSFDVEERVWR